MPEGDSLHRAALRLQPLVGHVVAAHSPHPRGLLTGVAARVDGRRLESVQAIGKHLLLRFDGGVTIRSHLRMTGRWRVGPVGESRPGRPWLVLVAPGIEATQWNGPVLTLGDRAVHRLGPDILAPETDPAELVHRLRHGDPGRMVGEALQDQRLVAGIGNMWMSEALWHVRISPWLPVASVSDEELRAAFDWVRGAMLRAVSSPRPERMVYRRAGRPCRRCGAIVSSRGQGEHARTAYWCARCQKEAPPGGSRQEISA